jgi:hypothetical protein
VNPSCAVTLSTSIVFGHQDAGPFFDLLAWPVRVITR